MEKTWTADATAEAIAAKIIEEGLADEVLTLLGDAFLSRHSGAVSAGK